MNRVLVVGWAVAVVGLTVGVPLQVAGVPWWGFAMCCSEALAFAMAWRWTRPPVSRPRLDYARIAELERSELGIDPRSERRPNCRHKHPHTHVSVDDRVDTICLDCGISLAPRPVPPPGPGAGSPIRH